MACGSSAGEVMDTSDIDLGGGRSISHQEKVRYLGQIFNTKLTSEDAAKSNISKASGVFALMKGLLGRRDLKAKTKGRLYAACCLSILMFGAENWMLTAEILQQLNRFHHRCVRFMCGVNMHRTRVSHIRTETLLERLHLKSCQQYFDLRMLRWAGHIARMPQERIPRKFLTSWVADATRPEGHPPTSWVSTLVAVLKRQGISEEFEEWSVLAQDKPAWRKLTGDKTKRD
jgi:hypothetical protein